MAFQIRFDSIRFDSTRFNSITGEGGGEKIHGPVENFQRTAAYVHTMAFQIRFDSIRFDSIRSSRTGEGEELRHCGEPPAYIIIRPSYRSACLGERRRRRTRRRRRRRKLSCPNAMHTKFGLLFPGEREQPQYGATQLVFFFNPLCSVFMFPYHQL